MAKFSENARLVLEKRFLKTDRNGDPVEDPQDMFRRVAGNIASADSYYSATPNEVSATAERFYQAMISLKFLPATNCLRNAGRRMQQLFPCFVLPLEDSLGQIYETLKNSALIFRTGGGVGISFSRLRPRGCFLNSTGGRTSGPVSFMRLFDVSTEVINEGCMRYGGTMGLLRVDHPDIHEFIRVKQREGVLNNFNLSVAVTDKFMEALESGDSYHLFDPTTAQAAEQVPAEEVFDEIVDSAWRSAEPGLVFIDEVNRDNPTPQLGPLEAVNLCGEQPLLPYEGCNLGALTVSEFVTAGGELNYEELGGMIDLAVHFLDNSIDVNHYLLKETEKVVKGNRKIGLGIRGLAEMLIKMEIPYGSDAAVQLSGELMSFVTDRAHQASGKLAKKRGNFPNFLGSLWDQLGVQFMRNATCTTIAPNGTTSLIADCTGGIEPVFALAYRRGQMRTLGEKELYFVHPLFEKAARQEGFHSPELMDRVARKGSCQGMDEVPESVQKIFLTAHDIDPVDHVRMQASFQEHTDNAVSKTVNLPQQATPEEVSEVFRLAHQLECKGITVYRDKCRSAQVLNKSEGGED